MPRPSYFQRIVGDPAARERLTPARVLFRPLGVAPELPTETISEITATPSLEISHAEIEPAGSLTELEWKIEAPRAEPTRWPKRVEGSPPPIAPVVADDSKPLRSQFVDTVQRPERDEPPFERAPTPQSPIAPRARPAETVIEAAPSRLDEIAEPRVAWVAPAVRSVTALESRVPDNRVPEAPPVPSALPRAEVAPTPLEAPNHLRTERFSAPPLARPILEIPAPRPQPFASSPADASPARASIEARVTPVQEEQRKTPPPQPSIRLEPPPVAHQPQRPCLDEPAAGVRIGSVEVRITPPAAQPSAHRSPSSTVGMSRPAAAKPAARLSQGFRSFGLVQG